MPTLSEAIEYIETEMGYGAEIWQSEYEYLRVVLEAAARYLGLTEEEYDGK